MKNYLEISNYPKIFRKKMLTISFHKSIPFFSVACSTCSDSRTPGTGYLLWNVGDCFDEKVKFSWKMKRFIPVILCAALFTSIVPALYSEIA